MLRFLRVKRLAVIDAVEVEFGAGLNVLTGETGAGKSILVEAVGLLLGGRASADLVRTGEDTATIEAIFDSGKDEFIVRREITAQGRSRAFINGELATAGALKDLSGRLVELHGQHEHQTLLDPTTHLAVLDAFGGLNAQTSRTASAFRGLRDASDALIALRSAVADRATRRDFAAFQLSELDKAALTVEDEDVQLAARRQVLANADRVERLCMESYATLYESDEPVLGALGRGVAPGWRARRARACVSALPRCPGRHQVAARRSRDCSCAGTLRASSASPARAPADRGAPRAASSDQTQIRTGRSRTRSAGVTRCAVKSTISMTAMNAYPSSNARTPPLAKSFSRPPGSSAWQGAPWPWTSRAGSSAFSASSRWSAQPLRCGSPVSRCPNPHGAPAGSTMPNFFCRPTRARISVLLRRIVSGGELSRVMLAMKTLQRAVRASRSAPGLVFDEVDAGIGGRVADVVGQKLRRLGSTFQVLCITHLPQIAAAASVHFQIEKRVVAGRTKTTVARLDDNGRVEELSRMLGGAAGSPTPCALPRAR